MSKAQSGTSVPAPVATGAKKITSAPPREPLGDKRSAQRYIDALAPFLKNNPAYPGR